MRYVRFVNTHPDLIVSTHRLIIVVECKNANQCLTEFLSRCVAFYNMYVTLCRAKIVQSRINEKCVGKQWFCLLPSFLSFDGTSRLLCPSWLQRTP